jgi:SnoaL-like domain
VEALRRSLICTSSFVAKEWEMNTEQVAQKVVELCRRRAWKEAIDTLYADEIVSVEAFNPHGGPTETRGIQGVRAKADWWTNSMQVHNQKVSEPFVAHDRFVVRFDVDVTEKESKKRFQMSEVGVYTVKDGKIVREEFLPQVGEADSEAK